MARSAEFSIRYTLLLLVKLVSLFSPHSFLFLFNNSVFYSAPMVRHTFCYFLPFGAIQITSRTWSTCGHFVRQLPAVRAQWSRDENVPLTRVSIVRVLHPNVKKTVLCIISEFENNWWTEKRVRRRNELGRLNPARYLIT